MSNMKRRLCSCAGSAGVVLVGVCIVSMPVFAQDSPGQGESPVAYDTSRVAGNFDQIRLLPPGDATPRTADGHPDLTGRYYPNKAGRMLQGGYRVVDSIMRQFDSAVTPQEPQVYTPEGKENHLLPPFPYGSCPHGGTPISITMQSSEHGPMELIQKPGKIWILTEFPQTIRYIPTDGRPHSEDPDPAYVGESVGHWEGDTLVVDTIAVDRRVMNFERWYPSEEQHIVERFTRTSENYLVYDLLIEDPVVLAKPYVHVPRTWTLAQGPNDLWTEYLCTANEEPTYMQNMTPEQWEAIENRPRGGRGGQ